MGNPAAQTGRAEEGKDLPPVVGEIETFLRETIESLVPVPQRRGAGAPMVLPALCLWAGLVVCMLRGFKRQSQLWRVLTQYGLWHYPRVAVCEQAVRNRLAQGGSQVQQFFEQTTTVLAQRLAPYEDRSLASFAAEVVSIDEMRLDPLARTLPVLKDGKPVAPGQLPGKLATRFNIRTQLFEKVEFVEKATQNEKVLARWLIEGLPKGSLVLADLGYFGFAWFDELTKKGMFWISRLRENTSYEIEHVYYQDGETLDALVWLGAYRADRAGRLVRLVQFRVGTHLFRYITNVVSPHQLSMWEIAWLYARRWDIELAFKLIKRDLGLHLLWSTKTEVILHQVWAVLLIAQVLQALRKEVAGRAGVDVFEVSMPLMIEAMPQFALRGLDPVQTLVERGRDAKIIRPSRRLENRAPVIPAEWIIPVPEGTKFERKARHAQRKNGPRPAARRKTDVEPAKPPGRS